jgi:hypothetical protein
MDVLLNLGLGIVGSLIAAYLYQHWAAIGGRIARNFTALNLSFTPIDTTAVRWLSMIALAALSSTSLYVLVQGISSFMPSLFLSIVLGIGIQGTLFTASWIVAPNPTRYPLAIVMLAPSMAISIFFTFHYLYSSVTRPVEAASHLRDTRSLVLASLSEVEFAMRDQRIRRITAFNESTDWKKFVEQLDLLMRNALSNREAIETAQAADNERLKGELAALRKRLRELTDQLEQLERKVRGNANSPSEALNVASKRVQGVQDEIEALNRSRSDLAQRMQDEERGSTPERRRPMGRGPMWRQLSESLNVARRQIEVKQIELQQFRSELDVIQAMIAELGIRKAEQTALQNQIQELEARPNVTSIRVTDGGTISNSLEIRIAELQHSRGEFRHEWSSRTLVSMETNCRLLLQLISRTDEYNRKADPSTCDATAFLGPVREGARFEAEFAGYREQCIFTRDMAEFQSVSQVIERGRQCIARAGLEPAVAARARNAIDQAERAADPGTSAFAITTLALARGDNFAWLSLAIAFLMQLLMPMGAVFATRAAVAPVS